MCRILLLAVLAGVFAAHIPALHASTPRDVAAKGMLVDGLADAPIDLGISFNESLEGFFSYGGNLSFQDAYDQGKEAGRTIKFTCHVMMEHMRAFVNSTSKASVIDGSIEVKGLTPIMGASVSGGILNLFNGSVVDHELQMWYYLPFKGSDGNWYHLEGIKHVKGDNCTHFFHMATTLYIHVRTGTQQGVGNIVLTGIVQINLIQVVELVESFRILGNGTDADKLDAITEFAAFLVADVKEDCFNVTNWESQFWYIWVSDGTNGFLLDLIARPDTLELRLETYAIGQAPTVQKQYLPLESLATVDDVVQFGSLMELSNIDCVGSVNNISITASYALNLAENAFVPPYLWYIAKGVLPQIQSSYGRIASATVGGHTYTPSSPIVRTNYLFEVGLEMIGWSMISAMSFEGSDLRVEIMGIHLTDETTLSSAFVLYNQTVYHLNDPLLSDIAFPETGHDVNGTRTFSATISDKKKLNFSITCSAPDSQFAFLDQEGSTQIHTTVLGSCVAVDRAASLTYVSENRALLEVKANY